MEGSHHLTQELIESMLHSLIVKFIEKKLEPTFRAILKDAGLNIGEFNYTIPAGEISAFVRAKKNRISNAPVYEISFPLRFKIGIYHPRKKLAFLTLVWWVAFALTPLPTQEWGVVEATTLHLQLGSSPVQIPSPSSLPLVENDWWWRTPLAERTPISLEHLTVKKSTIEAFAHTLIAAMPTPTNIFLQLAKGTHYILHTAIRNTPPITLENTSPSQKKIQVSYILHPEGSPISNFFMQPLLDKKEEAFTGLSLGARVVTEIAITLQAPSENVTIQRGLRCIFTLKVNLKEGTHDNKAAGKIRSDATSVEIVLEVKTAPPVSLAHAEVVHSTEIKSSQDIRKVVEGLSEVTPQRIAQLVERLHRTIMSPHKFEELFGDELS